MEHRKRWAAAALVVAALVTPGCAPTEKATAGSDDRPVKLAQVAGTQLQRVILSPSAMERIGVVTAPVSAVRAEPATRAVPFSAVVYDTDGRTWVYVNPEPRTYVRAPVAIDRINGERALLTSGPPAGTPVVTVGAPELLGAEYGVGEGE